MTRQNIRKAIILISFLLFPVTIYYFSPAIIIYGAAEGIISGSFIVFLILFVSSLFLGRAWCGYLCPASGLQEVCTLAVNKRIKGGKLDWIKYFIWVPWITSIVMLFISSGIKKVDPLYQTVNGISVGEIGAYIVYYGVIGLIVIMSIAGGKRAFCHYVCWMAPFMTIGLQVRKLFKFPSLYLLVDKDKCNNCGFCSNRCAMSLEVSDMVKRGYIENAECILCGECVDNCPKGVIRYSFCSNDTARSGVKI